MGTKLMCGEGGCGVCVVQTMLYETVMEKELNYAINSCLCPLLICDGWEITTVEGIGCQKTGLDQIQTSLAEYNGTQCGYCSPGQVMNMYSFLTNPSYPIKMTQQAVENAFDGIICRCTGYRSILDAMKVLVTSSSCSKSDIGDIEDLKGKLCKRTGKICTGQCSDSTSVRLVLRDAQWYKPTTEQELIDILKKCIDKKIRFIMGNTGTGVFKDLNPANYDVLIDMHGMKELYGVSFDPTSVFGSNLTLSVLIEIFERVSAASETSYMKELAIYLSRVANVPVRNAATWTGNIMLKHQFPDFPSDVFTMLVAMQSEIGIGFQGEEISVENFLSYDMTAKVITYFSHKILDPDEVIKLYKVMPRAQNAHAYVNAGFRMRLDSKNNFMVKDTPVIVYGGINKNFVRATKTERFLKGNQLGDPKVLKGALSVLQQEVVPDSNPVLASPSYRKQLTLILFYKFVLQVIGDKAGVRFQSATDCLSVSRPVSSGKQTYDTQKIEYPLTEPLQKLEANAQVTGEAVYIDDIPAYPNQLYAAFFVSTVGNAKIQGIDTSGAMEIPGVVRVVTHNDIPDGCANTFSIYSPIPEEVFCSGQVLYAGQAIGLVLAESQKIADSAAQAVKVTYTDVQTPLVDLDEAIQKQSFYPKLSDPKVAGDADAAIKDSPKTVTGSISMGGQYHMHMETQISICVPTEDGMDVHSSTQWIDGVQTAISQITGLQRNVINVEVKRLGGSYGGKITRNHWISAACGLAAFLTNRPVKLKMDFHTNMNMIGKRYPYRADYTVGFTDDGELNGLKIVVYADCGASVNDNAIPPLLSMIDNAYDCANWTITPIAVKTNKPASTTCRSPGSLPGIFIIETIMEHISKSLNKDPTDIRVKNLYQQGQINPLTKNIITYCNISQIVQNLRDSADVQTRLQKIQEFNQANRWKKKGLSIVPIKFGILWNGITYGINLCVYASDGTVAISHSGIEVGQGINTKVAQVCAYEFGIPISMIKVKSSNSFVGANSITTGGSITSESCCQGIVYCCQVILQRMAPVKAKIKDPTWLKIVHECVEEEVDLVARSWYAPVGKDHFQYYSYGATCAEVELDVLTGEHQISRVDIIYDCGESMNPAVDIGQVEGAFVMGIGYWMTEELKYDPQTGQLLTNSTWEYKPPLGKDIPVDFRVNLLKNAPNPLGVLRSKAVGEPPMCMSCSVLFAAKHAIESARQEIGQLDYFPLDGPATTEYIQKACLVDPSQFLIQ
ncbi:hypothetical protein CHS0354_031893 [Potamilus streckersoni]|uniref:FAD-binding PCMH-type domain-containing protein n=1 Tax=Potamilus streckersoni TaxID=2493646 RepID=A0AAE0RXT7_9BIVA|nr:hypothetical protein CHS0354_031893 [Potamilus streckersoni]